MARRTSALGSGSEDERKHLLSSPAPRQKAPAATSSAASNRKPMEDCVSERACPEKIDSKCNKVPVEILVFMYFFARAIVANLTGFYFFDTASHWYGGPSMDSLNPCGNGTAEHKDEDKARLVKQEAVHLDTLSSFTGYLPAVVPAVFLGPFTDRVGRRAGFVLPVLGTLCRCIVFLIVLGIENASPYLMYVGIALEGLGGSFGAMLMTSFSAVADVTAPGPQRGFRISVIEAVQVIASSAATLATGFWRRVSYTQPLTLCGALSFLCLVFALWFLPETLHSSSGPRCRRHDEGRRFTEGGVHSRGEEDGVPGRSHNKNASTSSQIQVSDGMHVVSAHESAALVHHASLGPGNSTEQSRSAANASSFGRHYSVIHLDVSSYDNFVGVRPGSPRDLPEEVREQQAGGTEGGRWCFLYCAFAAQMVRQCMRVYRRVDPQRPGRRCVLLLCFFGFLLTVSVNFSKPTVEDVYRMSELCWDAVKDSIYTSCWLVAHWVCILTALRVLQGCLHVHDVYVAMIGCVSGIAAVVVMAFATNDALVQISAAAGTFARALIPMLRSISSASVDVDEQGTLFATYACVELAGAAVFSMAMGQLYNKVAPIWNGIIFVIFAAILGIVLILLVLLAYRIKRCHNKDASGKTTYQTFGSE